jgi:hypothetical protein
MTEDSTDLSGASPEFLGAARFDPIEAVIRDRVREFIEDPVEAELDDALRRPLSTCWAREFGERNSRLSAWASEEPRGDIRSAAVSNSDGSERSIGHNRRVGRVGRADARGRTVSRRGAGDAAAGDRAGGARNAGCGAGGQTIWRGHLKIGYFA